MRDHSAFEFEGGVGGVIRRALVWLALLIDAFGDVSGAVAAHGLGFAEEVLEHILPVAEHVHDDATVVLLAVVPTWALGWDGVTFKNPVSELAAHTEDFAEEAGFDEALEFDEAGEPELVLNNAVFDSGFFAEFVQFQSGLGINGDRFFAVDVLSGGNGLAHASARRPVVWESK